MNEELYINEDVLNHDTDLLGKTVSQLMDKFGAGNHKPGSGSAAAFQGMVSAKLISTVISLTAEEKRKHLYSQSIIELLEFHKQIEERIYLSLSELFISDSIQFDKTIKLREARDNEEDEIIKNQLRRQALEELKISINIPFEIASLCAELADIAVFVFDNAFKSARGDSQVGLSGAVSAMAGCMAIIRLNVLSYNSDEYNYTKYVVNQVNNLDKNYQRLNKLADSRIDVLRNEFEQKVPLFEGINNLINNNKGKKGVKIEDCARELQILIWNNRHLIWKKKVPTNYLEILRPDLILKQAMGYDYISSSSYGVLNDGDSDPTEVLGIIDQPNKIVAVSDIYSAEIRNFTSAHELGHAILHEQSILHRDKVDSLGNKKIRDEKEIEADKFATYFLMPKKGVTEEFENRYSKQIFQINEDSAFKFGGRTTSDLKKENKSLRSLSKKLASSEMYDGKRFVSLSEVFKVSNEAMAIRLEELNLVKY